MHDFHLSSIGKTCSATGKPLVPGTVCYSAVVEVNGAYQRLDFSPEGWKKAPANIVGYWVTTVPDPAAGNERLDPEALMQYFEQLSEEASPSTEQQRYVLALLLLRMKRLRLEQVRFDDSTEMLELSGMRGEGDFEVTNLKLDDQSTSLIQQQLREQLAAEWRAAA